ncbi:MAG TPA: hypothetical protein VMW05_05255 [Methyloceanibacter sp.]|nr:hypothetical protein [Methyloceanibacter sp.]
MLPRAPPRDKGNGAEMPRKRLLDKKKAGRRFTHRPAIGLLAGES